MAMRWYILHCNANFEKQAARSIREQAKSCGFAHLFDPGLGEDGVMVPIERVIEVRQGVRVDAERNIFPGYVLVRCEMTEELARCFRTIPHVTGFLGKDREPMPIADAEIDRMLAKPHAARDHASQSGSRNDAGSGLNTS